MTGICLGNGYRQYPLFASMADPDIPCVYKLSAYRFRVVRTVCMILMMIGFSAGLSARAVAFASGVDSISCLLEINCHDHDHEHQHPEDGHDHHDDCPDHHHHHHDSCCFNLPLSLDKVYTWRTVLIATEVQLEWPLTKSIPDDPFLADEKPPLI